MIERFIDFIHEHLEVLNMNNIFFIFNQQLIKWSIIVLELDAKCSFMSPVNFFISSFSTEHQMRGEYLEDFV